VRELERKVILKVLHIITGTANKPARTLGISYRALLYKIRDAGLPSNAHFGCGRRRRTNCRRRQVQQQRGRRRLSETSDHRAIACRKRTSVQRPPHLVPPAATSRADARQFPLDRPVLCIATLYTCSRAIGTRASSSLPRPARRLAFNRNTHPSPKAVIRLGCGDLPSQYECARVRTASAQRRTGGHWAVRVSGNWRLTFAFEGEDAILVDYKDYH